MARSSASTHVATSAASESLSPTLISSIATVSFSFTTGMTPSSSSRWNVRRALRKRLRDARSSAVSST
jgi:hypothetical protein